MIYVYIPWSGTMMVYVKVVYIYIYISNMWDNHIIYIYTVNKNRTQLDIDPLVHDLHWWGKNNWVWLNMCFFWLQNCHIYIGKWMIAQWFILGTLFSNTPISTRQYHVLSQSDSHLLLICWYSRNQSVFLLGVFWLNSTYHQEQW